MTFDEPVFDKVEHLATSKSFVGSFLPSCICGWIGNVCNTEKEAMAEASRHEFAKSVK